MAVDNSNVSNETQSLIYTVLNADSTLKGLTKNIYDGNPPRVAKQHGFPMVIIDSPVYNTRKLTMSKWENVISTTLEVYGLQESVTRRTFDATVNAIKTGLETLHDGGIWCPVFSPSNLIKTETDDGKFVYVMTTTLEMYDVSQ